MNKVVCYVCGTSYPEDSGQCPVCGFTQPNDEAFDDTLNEDTGDIYYTYVKGGRFSKSNVRKRNKELQLEEETPTTKKVQDKRFSGGLLALLLCLFLVFAGFLVVRFVLPEDFLHNTMSSFNISLGRQEKDSYEENTDSAEAATETENVLSCTAVNIDATDILFEKAGNTVKLAVTVVPGDTTDSLVFVSSNDNVATVDETGLITAVGKGSATITVSCGAAFAECNIECAADPVKVTLNRKDITFTGEGQSWLLYSDLETSGDIVWSSDDTSVAIVEAGKVISVGEGTTVIHASYGNQTVSCNINCIFNSEDLLQLLLPETIE